MLIIYPLMNYKQCHITFHSTDVPEPLPDGLGEGMCLGVSSRKQPIY